MITENLSTLKIHKLTKEQYERELSAGNVDQNALYLTPYEEVVSNVSEVEISDTPPTDENVEIWVNMNEEPNGVAIYAARAGNDSGGNTEIISVQSDWNQTDENAADFIKNKPFGEEIVEVYNGDGSELEHSTSGGNYSLYEGSPLFDVEVGKTYIVNCNGAEYTCIAYDVAGIYKCIGDASIMLDLRCGDKVPFFIDNVSVDGDFQGIYVLDSVEQPALNIKKIDIKQIEPQYVQEMYYDNGFVDKILLGEQVVNFMAEDIGVNGNTVYYAPYFYIVFSEGHKYVVDFDGIQYEATCAQYENVAYIGNIGLLYESAEANENYPFLIVCENGFISAIVTSSSDETHTVKVAEKVHDIKQINEKYLSIMKSSQSEIFNETVSNEYICDYSIGLEVGKTYSVILDGVQYDNLECYMFNGMFPCIGSMENPEIPFIIASIDMENVTQIMIMTEGETHTLSIAKQGFVVDEKYLPSSSSNDLTFDTIPTEGSANPVTSEGIKAYIDNNKLVLPEGYPVDNRTKFIEWDGPTEGQSGVAIDSSGKYYQVSEDILTEEEIKSSSLKVTLNGNPLTIKLADVWDEVEKYDGLYVYNSFIAIAQKEHVTIPDSWLYVTFTNPGIYFSKRVADGYSHMTTSLTVGSFSTMSKELLPSDIVYKDELTWNNLGVNDTGDTITWNGDIEGREVIGNAWYKVSDTVVTLEDLASGGVLTNSSSSDVFNFTEGSMLAIEDGVNFITIGNSNMPYVVIVDDATSAITGYSTGIYLLCLPTHGVFITSLMINNYTGFAIKKIDKQFLPSDIAYKSYVDEKIDSLKTEFILNSSTEGSTKRFKITVDDSGTISAVEI